MFLVQSDKNSGGKWKLAIFSGPIVFELCRYLNFVFAVIFTECISMFHVTFFLILYFDWLLGPHKAIRVKFRKIFENLLLRNCLRHEACTLYTCF